MIGDYSLQYQRGAKGYYGKIFLEVNFLKTQGIKVQFRENCDSNWRIGIEFGIKYGWEQYQNEQQSIGGTLVEIIEVSWQMVDSNSIVMAYVTANAFWKAINWLPKKPIYFDQKTGSFSFSK